MLCKSGSNWLDRLWSIKGLPAADNNLKIDHFLNNPQPSDSTRPSQERPKTHEEEEEEEGEADVRTSLQNTLCELFNMKSESSTGFSRKKKIPRKQVNPKCVYIEKIGNCGVGPVEAAAGARSMIADNEGGAKVAVVVEEEGGGECEEQDEEEGFEGYSRSDVTVIDTSFEVWKSDKWVFRKNDVWKAKEKKGKSRSLLAKKKKRKGGVGDGDGGVKKKAKISRMLKDPNYNQQDGSRKEVPEDSRDYFSQVPRKRIRFSRSPKKFKRVTTPVVVIKGLPPISEAKLSKIPAEDTQRQHQA